MSDHKKSTSLKDVNTEAIQLIASLGIHAAGGLEPAMIAAPEGLVGVPQTVPVMVRTGEKPEVIDLKKHFEPWRTAPERLRGTATMATLASFIALVKRHQTPDSAIFARTEWPGPELSAVINYHTLDHAARYGDHRIRYAFPVTDEFEVWVKGNKTEMEQSDFARFLEDHAAELAAPYDAEARDYEALFKLRMATPAELMKLSRDLEITATAKIKRSERLQSGERTVQFVEEHTNVDGDKIDIPGLFMVSLRAFIDGEPVRIPARLRYRVKGGAIIWTYELYQWEFWLRTQVQADLARAAAETNLPTFEGVAEA